jgi:putative membrane protein
MTELVNRAMAGSAAGFAATGPMTVLMAGLHPALPPEEQEPLPPRQITERAAASVGADLTPREAEAAAMASHFAYGTAAGAVYGLVAERLPLPPVVRGVGFGLAVWGGSYLGLLPATGLYRSAAREPAGRNSLMIAAHVVWGAVLGLVEEQCRGRRPARP